VAEQGDGSRPQSGAGRSILELVVIKTLEERGPGKTRTEARLGRPVT